MTTDLVQPVSRSGTLMAANSVVQNVALPAGGGLVCRVTNAGPQNAYVEVSTSNLPMAAVPTANGGGGMAILANTSVNLVLGGETRVSAISDGNSTLYFTKVQVR